MENEKNSSKLSIITEFILFLVIVLITILLINNLYKYNVESEEVLSSKNIEISNKSISVEYQNEKYIKNLKQEYGVNIVYGDSSEKFATKFNANVQKDQNIINNNLKVINNAFEKYPKDAFNMFKTKKYPLNIIVVDSFNTKDIALASRNVLNEFTICISNNEKFERALHHEMYHVFEYYILDTRKNTFLEWKNLNPEGFSYSDDTYNINDDYVYDNNIKNIEQNNSFFVTKYSKYSEKEDRAEIFAEIMIASSKPNFIDYSKNIYDKVSFLNNLLKENLTTSKFNFSKFLK